MPKVRAWVVERISSISGTAKFVTATGVVVVLSACAAGPGGGGSGVGGQRAATLSNTEVYNQDLITRPTPYGIQLDLHPTWFGSCRSIEVGADPAAACTWRNPTIGSAITVFVASEPININALAVAERQRANIDSARPRVEIPQKHRPFMPLKGNLRGYGSEPFEIWLLSVRQGATARDAAEQYYLVPGTEQRIAIRLFSWDFNVRKLAEAWKFLAPHTKVIDEETVVATVDHPAETFTMAGEWRDVGKLRGSALFNSGTGGGAGKIWIWNLACDVELSAVSFDNPVLDEPAGPVGRWTANCNDGVTASGPFVTARGNGTVEVVGRDAEGRTVSFSYGAEEAMASDLGDEASKVFQFAGHFVPLPEGNWIVIGDAETVSKSRRGDVLPMKHRRVILAKITGNRLDGAIELRTNTESLRVMRPGARWNLISQCRRKDMHHVEAIPSANGTRGCWFVNHFDLSGLQSRAPAFVAQLAGISPELLQARDYVVGNGITDGPENTIGVSYYLADQDRYLIATYHFNPELEGFPDPKSPKWEESEWHPSRVAGDAQRANYIENIREWGASWLPQVRAGFAKQGGGAGQGIGLSEQGADLAAPVTPFSNVSLALGEAWLANCDGAIYRGVFTRCRWSQEIVESQGRTERSWVYFVAEDSDNVTLERLAINIEHPLRGDGPYLGVSETCEDGVFQYDGGEKAYRLCQYEGTFPTLDGGTMTLHSAQYVVGSWRTVRGDGYIVVGIGRKGEAPGNVFELAQSVVFNVASQIGAERR